jgi:glycine/D-amino acid oxidase-like deaminating enzyme
MLNAFLRDMIVIGGDLVGGAIAWGAKAQGASVLLLDEGDIAYRAARGNSGLVWVQRSLTLTQESSRPKGRLDHPHVGRAPRHDARRLPDLRAVRTVPRRLRRHLPQRRDAAAVHALALAPAILDGMLPDSAFASARFKETAVARTR